MILVECDAGVNDSGGIEPVIGYGLHENGRVWVENVPNGSDTADILMEALDVVAGAPKWKEKHE